MSGVWESARLVYRSLETEHEPFLEVLGMDAEAFVNSAPFLPTPQGKKQATSFREFLEGKLISAVSHRDRLTRDFCSKKMHCNPVKTVLHNRLIGVVALNAVLISLSSAAKLIDWIQVMCLPASSVSPTHADQASNKPTPIGIIYLEAIDPRRIQHRRTDLGINIARQYQGQGYGTEAIKWALDWGFRYAGLHRIEINAFAYNKGALKLYERIGFIQEGRKRDFVFSDGRFWDAVEFSMLEDEWREKYGKR